MKKILLITFLFVGLISFSQDEIKYKTAFENVEQNCDSLKSIEICYLSQFKTILLRNFTNEIKSDDKLSKHINDNIYLEIEIDTTGTFLIKKIKTKSSKIEKSFKNLVSSLPNIKPFVNTKGNNFKLKATLDFNLRELNEGNKEIFNSSYQKENVAIQTSKFSPCDTNQSENTGKNCFQIQMNSHIKQNFNYPTEALENKIQGKAFCYYTINKYGKADSFIAFGANHILLIESIRILKLLPQFTPAKFDGKNIEISYVQPINFKLK